MNNYRNIIFEKDNIKILKNIRRKLKNYKHRKYLSCCLKNFTNGLIVYKSNKIAGIILIEKHTEPSLRPNYIDIGLIYYLSEEVFELLFDFLNSIEQLDNYYCIEIVPQNYNEYLLLRKKGFFIYNYDYFNEIETIYMIKYINTETNTTLYNKRRKNISISYPENGIYNLIIENDTL